MNPVAVLIPHFNNPVGLLTSVSSIQETVDLVIVDDGSEDLFDEDIIKNAFKKGEIHFLYLESNKGIEAALNQGLEFILKNHYPYIARLDCGDLCTDNRFSLQQRFLEDHLDYGLIGSYCTFIDSTGNELFTYKYSSEDKVLRRKMYLNSMFIHPTVMFRKEIVEMVGLYPYDFPAAEDYAYFFSMLNHCKVSNIESPLVFAELNPNGISSLKRKKQLKSRLRIILKHFYLGYYPVLGVLKTGILFLIPLKVLNYIKKLFL